MLEGVATVGFSKVSIVPDGEEEYNQTCAAILYYFVGPKIILNETILVLN